MKRAHISVVLAVAATACGALGGCAKPATAPAAADKPAASAPSSADNAYASLARLPDWGGVWEPMRFAKPSAAAADGPPPRPRLTPKYEKQFAAFEAKNKTTPGINFVSDVANCVPPGVPGSMQQPYPFEFLFTPNRVTILIETYSLVRRVYTDGTVKPDEGDPSYQGTSAGHWDGDTLVVDTGSILPETSPLNGINGHGEKMRVTERIRLSEPDVLEIVTTRDDPTVFVEPFATTAHYQRHRDWKIMEYVCAQNNHDALDEHGNPGFSLERKPGE